MKNILILIIAITLASSSLQGQLYVGAKLGLAPSLMSFESQPNHKSSPIFLNPLAGIMVEIPIVFGFSIQPEVQFVTRGTKLKAIRTGNKAKAIIAEEIIFQIIPSTILLNLKIETMVRQMKKNDLTCRTYTKTSKSNLTMSKVN